VPDSRGSALEAVNIASYDTDLTDAQWKPAQPHFPSAKNPGRLRTSMRDVFNAVFYLLKSGCPWLMLPTTFPPWNAVYHHFRQWSRDGIWSWLSDRLRAQVRKAVERDYRPTAAALDSQTMRSDPHGGRVGYDAAKETKGASALCWWMQWRCCWEPR
jgi:putative transposase